MNGITFNRQNGGLGRRLPGEDHISGLIILNYAYEIGPMVINGVDDFEGGGIGINNTPELFYHASEYFRLNPGSKLYICAFDFLEYRALEILQNFAGGKIRQVAILDYINDQQTMAEAITNFNARAVELAQKNMPLVVLYQNVRSPLDLPNLPDLKSYEAERTSVLIGEDGAGLGRWFKNQSVIILGCAGAVLGAVSRAKVQESIAWVERQNLVTTAYDKDVYGEGTTLAKELDVPAFVDGSLVSSYTRAQLQTLHDKGYIFMVKHVGMAGTYLNDSFTATGANSDFAYIENNRTMDKAQRGVYTALLPKISGPLLIDATSGFIREDVAASLEALAAQPLEQMERDGEISGFNVFINPEQEVLQTSVLNVTLSVVPVGVMRNIVVNLGFTLQV